MTIQQILTRLRAKYRDLLDVAYHSFHPTIRDEVGQPAAKRRLAECGFKEGKRLYGLPHWNSARVYIPGVKNTGA